MSQTRVSRGSSLLPAVRACRPRRRRRPLREIHQIGDSLGLMSQSDTGRGSNSESRRHQIIEFGLCKLALI